MIISRSVHGCVSRWAGWLVLLVRSSLIMFVFLSECVAVLGVSPSVLLVVASLDVLARLFLDCWARHSLSVILGMSVFQQSLKAAYILALQVDWQK